MGKMKETFGDRQEIVSAINKILETTWTNEEVRDGKVIDIPPGWRVHMSYLLPRYKQAGWVVTRSVELSSEFPGARREYLSFVNPLWLKCPTEIRVKPA